MDHDRFLEQKAPVQEFQEKRYLFRGPESSFPFKADIAVLIIAQILQLLRQVDSRTHELLGGECTSLFLHVTGGEGRPLGGLRSLRGGLETPDCRY
jgi:hypothetical protein